MNKNIKVMLLALFFVSCAFQTQQDKMNEIMKSWEGHHKSDLIQKWGPAHNISEDGKGGQVYSYYYSANNTATTSEVFGVLLTRNNSYIAERHFYVNESGYIYYWRWKGL